MSRPQRIERTTIPSLVAGQHLDQPTFHERYEAMPPETRAELIGGVVFLTPPHRIDYGAMSRVVSGWLCQYEMRTVGLVGADRCTIKMDLHCEVEPECCLCLPQALGGKSWVDHDGYLCGAPELLIEIDDYSRDIDLVLKKYEYERIGIQEYLFVGIHPKEVLWFIRRGNHFDDLPPGPDGIYRSEVFPGLWLDAEALFARDWDSLYEAVGRGVRTRKHAAFVAKVAEARGRARGPK
jgi:Uma2 family endonuclease